MSIGIVSCPFSVRAHLTTILAGFSSEYQANIFMQRWVSQNIAPTSYLLNAYVGAILVAIVAIAAPIPQRLSRRTNFLASE